MNRPPLTRATVFRLAWPMIFANAAIPLAGVVDTAVIGAAGDKADLGGVALGVTLFNIFYFSFYFLRMSTTGLAAQAIGAEDRPELHRILLRALGLAAVLGFLTTLFRHPIGNIGFSILQGGSAVEAAGRTYFLARAWGAVGAYSVFALTGWLIGHGRTGTVTVIHLTFSFTNILLDLWFVFGLGLGVAGVAWATSLADILAGLVALGLVWREIRRGGGLEPRALERTTLWSPKELKRLVVINWDMMIRSWALLAGFAWFANSGAKQGAAVLAGNHVLLQIVTLSAFVLDAFAFTTETAVGQAIGRRSIPQLRRAIRLTTELAFGSGALLLLVILVAGPWGLGVVVADPEARASALRYLPYCAIIPTLGVFAWQLDGIFTGAMRTRAMRNASVMATAMYVATDLLLTPRLGPHGLWLAFLFFYVARAGTLAWAYPAVEAATNLS